LERLNQRKESEGKCHGKKKTNRKGSEGGKPLRGNKATIITLKESGARDTTVI